MEDYNVEEIEQKRELYSLNINELIKNFNEHPENYQMLNQKDRDGFQTIMIMEGKKKLLLMQLDEYHVMVEDMRTGFGYTIESDKNLAIYRDNEYMQEVNIEEKYAKSKEVTVQLLRIIDKEKNETFQINSGTILWENEEHNGPIYGEVEMLQYEETEEDEEIDEEDEIEEDDSEEFEDEEKSDLELQLEQSEKEFFDDEDDKYLYKCYIEDSPILLGLSKNGKKYSDIKIEKYVEITKTTQTIIEQIADDLDVRLVEIGELRKGLCKIFKLYENDEKYVNPATKDLER